MLSITAGPMQGLPDAIHDLKLLLTSSPKAHDDWVKEPITRMVLAALEESVRGRAPVAGLSNIDYAQAVGEIVGMQRAVVALKDPVAFLGQLGLRVGDDPRPLPPPSYAAPEPPPSTIGEK